MSASQVYTLSERTACWRTQTPGVAIAGSSTISAWCYSSRRSSLVWGQDTNQADVYCNTEDDDLDTPIPGAALVTFPNVPDGDLTAQKTFHEVVLTISVIDEASSAPNFDVSFGADGGGTTSASARELPNNPATPSRDEPAFYQLRALVPRGYSRGQSLIVHIDEPGSDTGMWRLHAIEPVWEPCTTRSTNR
jgi:hypothetical protein